MDGAVGYDILVFGGGGVMARTELVRSWSRGGYGHYFADVAGIYMQAADAVNGNQVELEGSELVIVVNEGAGAETITMETTPDYPYNRTEDDPKDYSIGAGETAVFGPFSCMGWRQIDGKLQITASSADLKIGVVHIGENAQSWGGDVGELALPQGGMLLLPGGEFLAVPGV